MNPMADATNTVERIRAESERIVEEITQDCIQRVGGVTFGIERPPVRHAEALMGYLASDPQFTNSVVTGILGQVPADILVEDLKISLLMALARMAQARLGLTQ